MVLLVVIEASPSTYRVGGHARVVRARVSHHSNAEGTPRGTADAIPGSCGWVVPYVIVRNHAEDEEKEGWARSSYNSLRRMSASIGDGELLGVPPN
jgi:hypothetical protein